MSSVVCIFPKDDSTDFLIPIYESLENISDFKGFRIDTTNESGQRELFSFLSNNRDGKSLMFFLGHGASNCLYGSPDSDNKKVKLFDKDNINILSNHPIICLACNSNDFLKGNHPNYIGFGNIPSDFMEVEAIRNYEDSQFLNWAEEKDIVTFRKSIVEVFVRTIKTTHCDKLSNFFSFLKLLINKMIATLLMERNTSHYREIADILYEFADEMELTQPKNY